MSIWDIVDSCAAATSVLGNLEPLLATAFGVNIAYLTLERFRYRTKIRNHAQANLARFKDGGTQIPPKLTNNKWYKEVLRLALLDNHDEDLPKPKNGKASLPDGRWPTVYALLFESQADRTISTTLAIVTALLLLTGVAHQVWVFTWVRCMFTPTLIPFSFWFAVIAIILPALFMHFGKCVVRWGTRHSQECVDGLLEVMQQDVQTAELTGTVGAPVANPAPTAAN